jgi:hypothetical protein
LCFPVPAFETKYNLTCDSIIDDKTPLPPPGNSEEEEAVALQNFPYIDGPVKVDYGTNLRYSPKAEIPSHLCSPSLDSVKVFMSTSTALSSILA